MQEDLGALPEDRVEHHADQILRASGSSLGNYTMPSTRGAILDAVKKAMRVEQTGTVLAYLHQVQVSVDRAAQIKRVAIRAAIDAVYGSSSLIRITDDDFVKAERAFDDVLLYGIPETPSETPHTTQGDK